MSIDSGAIVDVADQLFGAITNGDIARVKQLFDDDVLVWHSGDTRDSAKERASRVIDWFINATVDRRYEVTDRQFFDGGFVQQHILHANGRTNGSIHMHVCIVIKVGPAGLITRVDEYFDPAEMAPLLNSANCRETDMASLSEFFSDPASAGTWAAVADQSTVTVTSKSLWGAMPVKVRFTDFSGEGQVAAPQTVSGRIDVKAASLRTGIGKRDDHLRSSDFFEVEKFPDITVVVTGADPIEVDTVALRAHVTIKDTTRPVELKTKVTPVGDGGMRLTSKATINRQDFSVDGNLMGMITDTVTISGDLVFRRAP
jgi:polyisoprenoid-binding protein YceI/ketosteroid isomerase-like protein